MDKKTQAIGGGEAVEKVTLPNGLRRFMSGGMSNQSMEKVGLTTSPQSLAKAVLPAQSKENADLQTSLQNPAIGVARSKNFGS